MIDDELIPQQTHNTHTQKMQKVSPTDAQRKCQEKNACGVYALE